MNFPDPIICGSFLVLSFVIAGFVQTFWLRSPFSKRFQVPIDGQGKFRGKRIFGDNKTWRGFAAMVPAVGIAFIALRLSFELLPAALSDGLWPLSWFQYGVLGCLVGLGFMIGELPNSFIKRQLDIPPGEAPSQPFVRPICFVVDRFDSILGGMIVLSFVVPLPWLTWLFILIIGPIIHLAFNFLLFQLGVKARPA